MSVISRALKTAQQEKDQRTGGHAGGVPPIIPPRGGQPASSQFSWKNAVTMAVASTVIVVSLWVLYGRMRNLNPRPMQNIPVAMVPVEPAVEPAIEQEGARSDPPFAEGDRAADDIARGSVSPPPRVIAPPVTQGSEPAVVAQRAAAAPARPTGGTAAAVPPASAPAAAVEAGERGRLRIQVEQPLEGDAARLFAAGVAAHRSGDTGAARAAYERVLAVQPGNVDALNNMGILLAGLRELDRAEALLRMAVSLAPRHAGAWNNLGNVLSQRGLPGDAVAAFHQTLSLDPQHQGARVSMAQQHLALGDAARARAELATVIAGHPALAEAHYALGQAFEAEEDWSGAVAAYREFIRVAPPRLAAHVQRVEQRVQLLTARMR